ncbi:MAG: hypothetical protein F9K14_15300 [Candidatus Methanoperedens sp.]|nr:MAG: hypothetical protein F9K14_15300 [Candidatus Methanoperedens sp.]
MINALCCIFKEISREGYRIRVGDYRILYVIDDKDNKIEIISVALRKEVYR